MPVTTRLMKKEHEAERIRSQDSPFPVTTPVMDKALALVRKLIGGALATPKQLEEIAEYKSHLGKFLQIDGLEYRFVKYYVVAEQLYDLLHEEEEKCAL